VAGRVVVVVANSPTSAQSSLIGTPSWATSGGRQAAFANLHSRQAEEIYLCIFSNGLCSSRFLQGRARLGWLRKWASRTRSPGRRSGEELHTNATLSKGHWFNSEASAHFLQDCHSQLPGHENVEETKEDCRQLSFRGARLQFSEEQEEEH
jgi:hypothetical protein